MTFAAHLTNAPQIARETKGTLPALIDRAAQTLASARTSAEILEARDFASVAYDAAKKAARFAKAKNAHDSLIADAHRFQADALEIECLAKRRLADEYDAAQERGEVQKHGGQGKRDVSEQNIPSVQDIGLTRKDIHEARQLRDAEQADPGIVERTLLEQLKHGDEPTKARLRKVIVDAVGRGVKNGGRPKRQSRRNPHYAPDPQYDAMLEVVGACRSILETGANHSNEYILSGFLTEKSKQRNLGDIRAARKFLHTLLETANA